MNYCRSFSTKSVKGSKVQTEQMFSGLHLKTDAQAANPPPPPARVWSGLGETLGADVCLAPTAARERTLQDRRFRPTSRDWIVLDLKATLRALNAADGRSAALDRVGEDAIRRVMHSRLPPPAPQ
jgi:hypothetical protein